MGHTRLQRPRVTRAALALALLALAAPASASAAPTLFWKATVGQITPGARGIAVAPAGAPNEGDVFVADQGGRRIVELTAWSELVKIWGWDVVASGPDDDTTAPEDQFEVCVPANGDLCKAGVQGTAGVGQFNSPQGVAVDSAGDVYVYENSTHRVQKFDPRAGAAEDEVAFLWSIGSGVDQGGGTPAHPGTICTAAYIANGDTCGAGSTGTGEREFGAVSVLNSLIAVDTSEAVYAEDAVYVGDVGRIQRFDTSGSFKGEVKLPAETINALAVDSHGNLYATYRDNLSVSKPDVYELDPTVEEPSAPLPSFAVAEPQAIAVAANGDLYVYDQRAHYYEPPLIRRFTSTGVEVESFGKGFTEDTGLPKDTGLAVSGACGIEGTDLFYSDPRQGPVGEARSYLYAFGPPPQDTLSCPQPHVPPDIAASYASSVGTAEASVGAQINPHFWTDATYYVQYGTAACPAAGWEGPDCHTALYPGAPLTAKLTQDPVPAAASLAGLALDTTYHFRFLAESGGGGPTVGPERTFHTYPVAVNDASCPNQAFRTGAAAKLPDCRAYEMVSPVEKGGGDVDAGFFEGFDASTQFSGLDQSTPAGSELAYTATGSFAGAVGAPLVPEYIARRTATGWLTESINPPMRGGSVNGPGFITSQFKAFSPDLCQGWLVAEAGNPLVSGPTEPAAGFRNIYRRENCSAPPAYSWLESSAPAPHPVGLPPLATSLFPDLQGVSADGGCAVFRVNDQLTAGAPAVEYPLYLHCEGAPLQLVSRLPNGTPLDGNASAGTASGIFIGGLGEGHVDTVQHALSAEGTRVYWSASDFAPGASKPSKEAVGKLFLRVNADQEQSPTNSCTEGKACTLQVSSGGIENLNKAQFWTASPNGQRAIFSISAGFDAGKLYEYKFNPATGTGASTLIAEKTLGVAGASEDATRVYLASKEVCSSAPNTAGDTAQPNEPNLYLYESGESCAAGQMDFVGTLAAEDAPTSNLAPSPLGVVPRKHVARASADGGQLLFVSAASLTGYDNFDAVSGQADREVYLYDADAAGGPALRCVSCNPSGARPHGADLEQGNISGPLWTAAYVPGYQHQLYGRRLIASGGQRVFFNSVDPLVLQDVNHAQDVYQWEAPETGDCTAASTSYFPQNGGCLALISSGQSPQDSEWVEASESGDDVFIRTSSSLMPRDPGLVDIYDARVEGGEAEPPASASCEGEACQSPPAPPNDPTPASSSFEGAGNMVETAPRVPCPKGKVRRHGRCVRKHRPAKHGRHHRRANPNRRAAR